MHIVSRHPYPIAVNNAQQVSTVGSKSVADSVASVLAASGVKHAFGHPGGEVVVLIDALQRHGIQFVLTRHEATAAFMAGGQGELTGIPGISVATLGPGATNLVTGVASAYLERAPMVALTGALSRHAPNGTTHQALELNALFAPITKLSCELTAVSAATETERGVRLARQLRPGPVHLSLPSDVAPVDFDGPLPELHTTGEQPAETDLAPSLALLRRSAKPALVVGLDAVGRESSVALRRLAHHLGAPVASTPKAKGTYPEDGAGYLGVLEMAGHDLVIGSLKDADLLVMIGVDVVEFDKPWSLSTPIIHLSNYPNEEGYYPAEAELVGPIDRTVERIIASVDARTPWGGDEHEASRRDLEAYVRPVLAGLMPWQVVDLVRTRFPANTIATSDVGAHKMLIGQAWKAFEPRGFFMANGLSSMGYSIPVATAVRLLRPEQPVVAFVGDGGFGMYLGELETLVRLRVDIAIVVLVDDRLEMIRRVQVRQSLPTDGTTIGNPAYRELGAAFGVHAREVETLPELDKALSDVLQRSGVSIVAAHVNRDGYRF